MPDNARRRLILLRHAKSDRPAGIRDLERPLNPRGRRAAPLIGQYMAKEGLRPDRAVISTSTRTRETWDAVREAIGNPPSEFVEAIYEAPAEALLAVIRSAPDDSTSLLLVGHNPGIQDLAMALVGSGPEALQRQLSTEFPTAALAVIDFDVADWADIRRRSGEVDRFVRPRDLEEEEA